jgi:hypothetical protein
MRQIPPNWAVLVAALARMALGALWYSPVMFLPAWKEETGFTDQQINQDMVKGILLDLVGSLLMSFVLLHAIRYAGAATLPQGLAVSFANFLGFGAAITIGNVGHERRSWKHWAINNGWNLASMLVMGVILTLWV